MKNEVEYLTKGRELWLNLKDDDTQLYVFLATNCYEYNRIALNHIKNIGINDNTKKIKIIAINELYRQEVESLGVSNVTVVVIQKDERDSLISLSKLYRFHYNWVIVAPKLIDSTVYNLVNNKLISKKELVIVGLFNEEERD